LNRRIKELREAEIVERTIEGYQLTQRGEELISLLIPFGEWSLVWSEEVFGYKKDYSLKKEQ
jgi:DNA-binding HxlR family transcriptional regulator